jgi:thiol-disulfide isomerase/thioredoxin
VKHPYSKLLQMGTLVIHLLTCLFWLACSPKAELDDFTKPELVTVAGRVLNPAPDNKRISLAVTRLGLGNEELESEIDNEGKFKFQFETYTPTDVWLIYQTNLLFVVHPGDSMFVAFDGSMPDRPELLETIKFSGDRETTNNQIAAFQKAYYSRNYQDWQKEEYAIKNYGPKEFTAYADTIRSEETNLYNDFLKTHSPNDEAEKWASFFVYGNHFVKMMRYPKSHRVALVLKESEWNVPTSYYNELKATKPMSESLASANAIYRITNIYLYGYLGRIVKETLITLKETDSEYAKDSVFLQTISEQTTDPQFRAIAITQYLNDNLSELRLDSYERNLDFIQVNIKEPFLIEPLKQRYSELRRKLDKLPLPENARIENITDSSNSFINNVINDNKGRPIYIDIWATWCGPCLEQFPYSKKLQKELPDVSFVYVCIESGRTGFDNTIKTFHLDGQHYFLNTAQSKALREELNINGIPRYLLIDWDGSILDSDFDQPGSDDTKKNIAKLLKPH